MLVLYLVYCYMVVLGSLPWLCEIEGLELLSEPSFP